MNNAAIRQQINQYLDELSSERLELVADFLAYLAEKESEEATQELLDIPGFIESFERGKKDIAEGRLKNWRGTSQFCKKTWRLEIAATQTKSLRVRQLPTAGDPPSALVSPPTRTNF